MLDRLRALFGRSDPAPAGPNPMRLAVGALLVEAARADEIYETREKRLIDVALADFFAMSADAAEALRAEAETVQSEAADLHRFTRIAKALSPPDKIRLIEKLWTIVLSDDRRDPHEDAMIRRVCGLIYVSDPDSAGARRRAANRLSAGGNSPT